MYYIIINFYLIKTISLSLNDNNELYIECEIRHRYYTLNIIYTHIHLIGGHALSSS